MKKLFGVLFSVPVFILVLLAISMATVIGLQAKLERAQVELGSLQERYAVVAYALKEFQIVRSPGSTGDGANLAGANIIRALRRADLNFGVIGASEAEVDRLVAEAYTRSARKTLAELKELKATPAQAEILAMYFFIYVERSEKNLTAFVTNANVVNELVARNYIGAAKARGARVSVSSLRQQGVAVGKTPSARKPVAKKKVMPTKSISRKATSRYRR